MSQFQDILVLSSCCYVKDLILSQQHIFHWLYQHTINPLKETVAAWISPTVPDLVLHRAVSQVFDIYAVTQTHHLTFCLCGKGRHSFRH